MLPRLQPRKFYDLVIEVAIVRPGPIQGDMVHPYLRRRQGQGTGRISQQAEMKTILSRTLGVPLFQEQAMRIAIEAGGFTPGEADQLRRAMATFKRTGTIGNYRQRMIEGMVARGYDRDFADALLQADRRASANTAFPKATPPPSRCWSTPPAGSRPIIPTCSARRSSTRSRWAFMQPAQLVRDARDHGVEIREVDVNHSDWDCTLEEADFDPSRIAARHAEMRGVIRSCHAVRLGLRQVKGVSEDDMKLLVDKRGEGYDSVRDVWLRTGLTARRSNGWRSPTPSARSGSTAGRRYGRCARWTARARPSGCRCSTGRCCACATTSRRCGCRPCRSAST